MRIERAPTGTWRVTFRVPGHDEVIVAYDTEKELRRDLAALLDGTAEPPFHGWPLPREEAHQDQDE
ncbi:hypothetical protein E1288_10840 [Saccharopolyspora elongata]|uniref:Uncharacterized protein n=2 Tax=Pseudonocardiaceae TaxID=2070 RepID=A0A4R4Z3Y5_9PSEU|nr:hypothetical protein E1288_10840 [Saccharopolyspora elongata]